MAKCGRRPVLDDLKKGQILGILAVGCSRRVAAAYVGCSPQTIQSTAGRDPDFAEQLGRVEQQAEIGYLRRIQKAASEPRYWRAAAWVLERRNPRDFAPRRPDAMDLEQVKSLMERLTAMIVEEVPVARYRKQILKRVEQMLHFLCPTEDQSTKSTTEE